MQQLLGGARFCAIGAEPMIHSSSVIKLVSDPGGMPALISSLHNLLECAETTAATLQTWSQTEESCWFLNICIDKKQQIQMAWSSHSLVTCTFHKLLCAFRKELQRFFLFVILTLVDIRKDK